MIHSPNGHGAYRCVDCGKVYEEVRKLQQITKPIKVVDDDR